MHGYTNAVRFILDRSRGARIRTRLHRLSTQHSHNVRRNNHSLKDVRNCNLDAGTGFLFEGFPFF